MNLNDHLSKIFWILLILTAGLIVINGITTEVSLGDESHHYRFAQNIYNTGKRVPFDPLYESGNPPGFYYNDPPLWHFGLAFLWKVTGWISQTIAQIYHVLFFILLVWCTSLLAKEITGGERRWFPALVIATVPMVVSFSTLFYMDVPMTALSTLSFYLILKRRYIEAGVASGFAYFNKLNSGFLSPGFLFIILWKERKKAWSFLKNMAFFSFPILMIYLLDLYWRKTNITSELDTMGLSLVSNRLSIALSGTRWKEYLNSYLTNPADWMKYFGFAFMFFLFFYFFRLKQRNKRGAVLWVPVFSYLICYVIIFRIETDVRYLLPILPFLVTLLTPSFFSLSKPLRFIIIGVCVLQFTRTVYYVHQKRLIPPDIKEGFKYIQQNIPKNALILYPEENLLIYGQRKIIWGAMRGVNMAKLPSLFWAKDLEEIKSHLKVSQIDYILIKTSRIYDDSKERHTGGYPKSFVEKLHHLDGWVIIFENSGMVLWKRTQPLR